MPLTPYITLFFDLDLPVSPSYRGVQQIYSCHIPTYEGTLMRCRRIPRVGTDGQPVHLVGVGDENCIADYSVGGGLPRYRLHRAPGGFGFGPTYGLVIERPGDDHYTVCKFSDVRDCYCSMSIWITPEDLSNILIQACPADPDLQKIDQEFHT
jgi:hypothetical protein